MAPRKKTSKQRKNNPKIDKLEAFLEDFDCEGMLLVQSSLSWALKVLIVKSENIGSFWKGIASWFIEFQKNKCLFNPPSGIVFKVKQLIC